MKDIFTFAAFIVLLHGAAFAQNQAPVLSTGSVVAKNSAVISAKVASYVEKINGEVGTRVKKGQALIKLDSAEFEANRALALARLDDAKAAFENAEINYQRMKELVEKGSTTKSSFDDAATAYKRAKAAIALAEAEVARANVFVGYATLTSPIDGVIDFKRIETGELTAPGQPLMKITDDKNLRFETSVKESDINRIKAGQSAAVLIDALEGKKVKGKVAHIVPSGDTASHSFMVVIDLEPVEGLRIGMYGKVRLSDGERG